MAVPEQKSDGAKSSQIVVLVRCLRPKQWTKNLLLFAGLLFTGKYGDPDAVLRVTAGFIIFCLISGVIYTINDVRDVEQDRLHPVKRLRPIACGLLPSGIALAWAVGLGVASLLASFLLGIPFAVIAIAYFLLNLFYSVRLKHVVIVDIFSIATGFVLRALAGVEILWAMDPSVDVSNWFLLCAFFLALFLAICKRRHEAVLFAGNGSSGSTRKVLEEYSPVLLDQMMAITTTSTILTYALWGALGQFAGERMLYTLPFVVFGIFRYLYLVYRKDGGGEPETILLTDIPLVICILLWLLMVMGIMYRAGV